MVGLSEVLDSKTLWIVVLVVQIFIVLFHLIKFYETWDLYLQGIVREIYILSIVILLFVL